MAKALGYLVVNLQRASLTDLQLDDLAVGR
jgi:16S rRNA U516 pseudouridylate synthase RsuA-like enzyme